MTTRSEIVRTAQSLVGRKRADGSHKYIIDVYNKHKPLARGYKVNYSDDYCAVTTSMVFISRKAVNLIGGTECGVQKFIDIFKKKGIWNENGRITPKAGDIICYNWNDGTQPNDGWADHIGIVEKVKGSTITIIEGNMANGIVGKRFIPVGWGYIRGYAQPKYEAEKKPSKKPSGSKKIDVTYRVYIKGLGWLDKVKNTDGKGHENYAGIYGENISALQIEAKKGHVKYRLHAEGIGWFDWVTDTKPDRNGDNFAGDLKKYKFDGLQIKATAGDVEYAVYTKEDGWLPYITNYGKGSNGYAGIFGHAIQGIRIKAIK